MIDTSIKKPPKQIRDQHMEFNDDQENIRSREEAKGASKEENKADPSTFIAYNVLDSTEGKCRALLRDFYKEAKNDNAVILNSLKTLIKILSNIVNDPLEEKFRSLDTTKKAMQEKILKFKTLCDYLVVCEFEDKGTVFLLRGYPKEKLSTALECITSELKLNAEKFGVKIKSNFNPYAESITSTTGSKVTAGPSAGSQYDPSYVDKMIEEEKKLKKTLMERKIENREVKVFNSKSGNQELKKRMLEDEEENRKEEEEYEEELRKTAALKFMGRLLLSLDFQKFVFCLSHHI